MSDMNIKSITSNKTNKLVSVNTSEAKEVISENIWIIGVSKTHPGLKYYFNTLTGVSLWNISREDMERAKQTMKSDQNQTLYINCPEPKDPPPPKRMSTNTCMNCKKHCRHSRLATDTAGFTCDVCFGTVNSPPNLITVNFRASPHTSCSSQIDNACNTRSQVQSTSTYVDNSILENNNCNKGLHQLSGNQKSQNKSIAETVVKDYSNEHLHNKSNNEEFHNHKTSNFETLDLTSLKMFAKNGEIKDKWYIIADADVYLQHIKLLESVVNSDNQCSLMVPQNVKVGLENATKTELRTKAYYATYFIYKMFDLGFALIDEDSSKCIEDKTNEEHILESCSKLRAQNFYVVVISNDIDLQKYRNKIYIPIFTVSELKEYLYKSDNSEATKSPEPRFNLSQSSHNINVVTQNNPCTSLLDTHESRTINAKNWNNRNRTSVTRNDIGTQVEVSKTVDTEMQTEVHSIQRETFKNASNNTDQPNQNDDIGSRMKLSTSTSHLCDSNSGTKRIKLRRRKMFNETTPNLTKEVVDRSENPIDISNTQSMFSSDKNLLFDKKLEEQIKNININRMHNKDTMSNTSIQKIKEKYQIPKENLKSVESTTLESKSCKDNIESKNVMFEITTDTMDENLRTRCDEWVSRFVQIMEEALTQVLRKNSSLHLPPPWNMYEAAICVEKKFHNDEDVQDASKKFLNILNTICDRKGNIKSNISPSQYMEMYSFGVYMIDALQGIFSKCEDLQSAAESLSKLLNDIQEPETDLTNIEPLSQSMEECPNYIPDNNDNVEVFMIVETNSHCDENHEGIENVPRLSEAVPSNEVLSNNNSEGLKKFEPFKITFTNSDFINNMNEGHTTKNSRSRAIEYVERNNTSQEDYPRTSQEDENMSVDNAYKTPETSPSRYNLRSKRVTTPSERTHTESLTNATNVTKDDRFENTFFSNLLLQRNVSNENVYNQEENFGKNITTEDIHDNVESSDYTESNIECSQQFNSKPSDISTAISSEPKVIRNFVVCSKFEDRLRTRRIHDEMEELDFEEETMAEDYLDEDVSSGCTGKLEIDEFSQYHDSVDEYHTEQEITKSSEYVRLDFKYFVRKIAEEIKELSSEVYTFSENSCKVLSTLPASQDKICIRSRAEQAHFYVNNICTALTQILNRDKNGGSNIQAILQHAEFDNISVDEEQLDVYRGFITRCLEHAHDLKNALEDVLSAVC